MKINILLLATLTTLGSLTANAKDTSYVSRQVLKNDIERVIINEYSTIEIAQGDSNCVFLYSSNRYDNQTPFCEIKGNTLIVSQPNSGKVKIVLRNSISELELKEWAKVDIYKEFLFKPRRSKIILGEYAQLQSYYKLIGNSMIINLAQSASLETDNLIIDSLTIKAENYTSMLANDGFVNYLNTRSVANNVKFLLRTKPCSFYRNAYAFDNTEKEIFTKSEDQTEKKKTSKKKNGYWDTWFNFGVASLNWSEVSFARGKTPRNFSIDYGTNYTIEAKAKYISTKKFFSAEIGIGYESDVINFTDNIVYENNGYNGNMSYLTDNNSHLKTKMVARYITLPAMITINLNQKLHCSAGFIVGLNYNNSHTGIKTSGTYQVNDETVATQTYSSYRHFNPYKLDFRGAFGFNGVQLVFQTSLVSMFKNIDLYPYNIGINISI